MNSVTFVVVSTKIAIASMEHKIQKFLPESELMLLQSAKLRREKELKEKLLRINLHLLLRSKKPKESLPKKEPIELQLKSKPLENLLKLVKPKELNKQEPKLLLDRKLQELLPKFRLQKLPELLKEEKL